MARLFGTDGIRGTANLEPLVPETILEIGRAVAGLRGGPGKRRRILIGRDTRASGDMLESALAAGICSRGAEAWLAGTIPTPGIAFLTRDLGADAGVMISASHNPFGDNGIKIFSSDGRKLPDREEDEIALLIRSEKISGPFPTGENIGRIRRLEDAIPRYLAFCRSTFPGNWSLSGMKIALDCANGAASEAAPALLAGLGAEVTVMHNRPDGFNINRDCGSQHTGDLQKKVAETGSDLGLAFDGDADRLIAVDEKGKPLSGDQIMLICAGMYKEQGRLSNNLVVSTVMSNFGFGEALKRLGIEHDAAKVGDRYVLELMRERGAVIGGEASGHVIFLDHHTTGDGLVSALQLLAALRFYRQPLSRLAGLMEVFPQIMVNVEVRNKPPLEEIPGLQEAVRKAEKELGGKGRILIRYSGTEALCRVMVEGPTETMTARIGDELARILKKTLG